MNTPANSRVVVTGVGAVTDLGHDAASTWDAMHAGRSGIRRIVPVDAFEGSDITGWTSQIAGQVLDWTPKGIEPREIRRLDRSTVLGVAAAIEAVEHSGWDYGSSDPTRCGVVVGSGIGGIKTIEDGSATLTAKGPRRLSPFTVPRLMVNAVAGNVAIRFNLQGPASAHATACASSGHAIGDALRYIRAGLTDVMVVGGAEAAVTPLCMGAFGAMKALSTRNDEPAKASRPFDQERDGFVMAEGAAMFVLESEAHAKARGAEIFGEIVGFGNSCDASHITAPNAEGLGASNAMRWAMRDAGLGTDAIDYINAHGTATPLGDSAELAAVMTVFGERALAENGQLLMSSTKSMHGHTLGASGAVEMIACLHAINDGVVAPTINLDTPETGLKIDLVAHEARQRPVRYAMNNTFGFGGHNVTIIAGKHEG